ncbi:MAG: hypothetical protein V3U60_04050 [Gammaproteobacteria bacterium]
MVKPLQIIAQIVAFALFAAAVGYFSSAPVYTHLAPDKALIKLSFSHPGKRPGCRRLSPEEIAALPPNMRRPVECPRERLPVLVELVLDGNLLFRDLLPPSGLWRDGASTVYQRFTVDAGSHRLIARLRDSAREDGFDYEHAAKIELAPQQNFVVDFRADTGGFIFY